MRNFFTGVRYFARGLGWVARRPGQWLFGGLGKGAARLGPEECVAGARAGCTPSLLFQRQATPAALTQDTQHRFGALHYVYPPIWWCPITWGPSPMQAAFPPSPAGRDSGDYYDPSVAIGLASLRRSHVRPRPHVTA